MSDKSGTPSSEITDGTDPPCVLVLGHPLEERVGRNQRPGMLVVVLIRVRRSPHLAGSRRLSSRYRASSRGARSGPG